MSKRVAVFIDYQNCYKGARVAFCAGTSSHVDGQVHPLRLGLKLKGVGVTDRELCAVFVYRGLPSSERDPKGYGAADRQIALWKKPGVVFPITRPLNYRDPEFPREKGIDVRIAIDMVMMVARGACDVAVLFSNDTDLLPALEAIIAMKGASACEVATWVPTDGSFAKPLRVPGHGIVTHRLSESDYNSVHDPTDYTQRRRRR